MLQLRSQLQCWEQDSDSTFLELALKNASCIIHRVLPMLFVFCQCQYNNVVQNEDLALQMC